MKRVGADDVVMVCVHACAPSFLWSAVSISRSLFVYMFATITPRLFIYLFRPAFSTMLICTYVH